MPGQNQESEKSQNWSLWNTRHNKGWLRKQTILIVRRKYIQDKFYLFWQLLDNNVVDFVNQICLSKNEVDCVHIEALFQETDIDLYLCSHIFLSSHSDHWVMCCLYQNYFLEHMQDGLSDVSLCLAAEFLPVSVCRVSVSLSVSGCVSVCGVFLSLCVS